MGRRIADDIAEQVVADYQAGMAAAEITARHGISHGAIYNVIKRAGVERRKPGQPFRGGRSMRDGYVLINVAYSDDMAKMMANGLCQGRYVLEHRLVMARHLGRTLAPNETVHHINGDRADNRLENLQLCVGQHGNDVALVCGDCGSHNLVPTKLL